MQGGNGSFGVESKFLKSREGSGILKLVSF